MSKFIGAICIVLSGVLVGYFPVLQLKQKIVFTRAMVQALRDMYGELNATLEPVPELIESLAKRRYSQVQPFYMEIYNRLSTQGMTEFGNIWTGAVEAQGKLLSEETRFSMCALGNILGKVSVNDQLTAIHHTVDVLEHYYCELQDLWSSAAKVFVACGTAVGLLITITLV